MSGAMTTDGLSPEQREQFREQFRKGIGSRPEVTPEFRERVRAIAEKLARK